MSIDIPHPEYIDPYLNGNESEKLNEGNEELEGRNDMENFSLIEEYSQKIWADKNVESVFEALRDPETVVLLQEVARLSDAGRHDYFSEHENYAYLSPLFDFVSMVNPASNEPMYPELFRLVFGNNTERTAEQFYGHAKENTSGKVESLPYVPHRAEIIHATGLFFPKLTVGSLKDSASIQQVVDVFNTSNGNIPFEIFDTSFLEDEVSFSLHTKDLGQKDKYVYQVERKNPYNTRLFWKNPNGSIVEIENTTMIPEYGDLPEIPTPDVIPVSPNAPASSPSVYDGGLLEVPVSSASNSPSVYDGDLPEVPAPDVIPVSPDASTSTSEAPDPYGPNSSLENTENKNEVLSEYDGRIISSLVYSGLKNIQGHVDPKVLSSLINSVNNQIEKAYNFRIDAGKKVGHMVVFLVSSKDNSNTNQYFLTLNTKTVERKVFRVKTERVGTVSTVSLDYLLTNLLSTPILQRVMPDEEKEKDSLTPESFITNFFTEVKMFTAIDIGGTLNFDFPYETIVERANEYNEKNRNSPFFIQLVQGVGEDLFITAVSRDPEGKYVYLGKLPNSDLKTMYTWKIEKSKLGDNTPSLETLLSYLDGTGVLTHRSTPKPGPQNSASGALSTLDRGGPQNNAPHPSAVDSGNSGFIISPDDNSVYVNGEHFATLPNDNNLNNIHLSQYDGNGETQAVNHYKG